MRLLYFFFAFLLHFSIVAQDFVEAGALIDLNAAIRFNRDWSLKSKLQVRESMLQNKAFEQGVTNPDYGRLDLQTVVQRKLNANRVVGAGILYRRNEFSDLVRFIQQFGWVNEGYRLKLAQRMRLDETLRASDDIEWRLRYRLGLQVPLEGFRLDKGEKYIITEAEVLGKYRRQEEGLESRFTLAYGSLFKKGSKGELGVDYRLDGLINSEILEHQFWLTLAYFFK